MGNICFLNKKLLTKDFTSAMVNYTSNEPHNQRTKNRTEGSSGMNEILTQEKSIYIQIREMIENDILRDILLEEERVPSTNELAKLYSINPATAAKGINLLVDDGILYKKRGIGMFVQQGAKEAIMKKRKEKFADKFIRSLLNEADSLGITREELIEMIRKNDATRQE